MTDSPLECWDRLCEADDVGLMVMRRVAQEFLGTTRPDDRQVESMAGRLMFCRLVALGWPDGTRQHSRTVMARLCRVSRRTIENWLKPPTKIGG